MPSSCCRESTKIGVALIRDIEVLRRENVFCPRTHDFAGGRAMMLSHAATPGRERSRSGAAAVELAALSPILVFLSMATVDYARVAYVQIVLQNCARTPHSMSFTRKPVSHFPRVGRAVGGRVGRRTVQSHRQCVGQHTWIFVQQHSHRHSDGDVYPIALPSMYELPSPARLDHAHPVGHDALPERRQHHGASRTVERHVEEMLK